MSAKKKDKNNEEKKVKEKPEKETTEKVADNDVDKEKNEDAVVEDEISLEDKVKESEEKYLRLCAEFDNFRKRTQQEKEDLAKFAGSELVKNLLPLMDSFERAKQSFEKHTDDVEELKNGLALIHKQFEDILEKSGVTKISAKGEMFDPNFHEAVMQQDAEGVESQTIIEEMQPGFIMNERVLRPAMVIVAK